MDDRTMVLVGTIHGGSSCNTLSGSCEVEISVRAADREMRTFLKERVKEICEGTAATFRGKAEVEFVYGMPSLYNDPAVCKAVGQLLCRAVRRRRCAGAGYPQRN